MIALCRSALRAATRYPASMRQIDLKTPTGGSRSRAAAYEIGRIERGSYNPTVLTLGAIAAALDSSLVEILAPNSVGAKLKAV